MAEESFSVISRAEARAYGLKRYFTGKPCSVGHISERATVNATCFACKAIADAKYYTENSTAIRARVSAYTLENKEKLYARARERGRLNLADIVARKAVWRSENIEHVRLKGRIYAENRRCRLIGAEGSHSDGDVKLLAKRQKFMCAGCSASIKKSFHEDHIMPLALGGSNWIRNIQLLCKTCNLRKHAKHPIDWARENGRLL